METETLGLITEMTNMIKDVNYDEYGELYFNTAINLLDKNSFNNNEYHILIEAPKTVIDAYKYKDKQILDLKNKVKGQDARISFLEETIKTQNTIIETQNIKITNLETRLTKQEQHQLFNKYVIGIQDFNEFEKLETKLACSSELKNLHNDRIDGCHYINKKYSDNEKAIRINLLIDKLDNIPENIKELFEDEYPGLLDELKPVLIKHDITIEDTRFMKKSNNWWEY